MSQWTKELPKEPGWYWWRKSGEWLPEPIKLIYDPVTASLYVKLDVASYVPASKYSDKVEWQGPLKPEE